MLQTFLAIGMILVFGVAGVLSLWAKRPEPLPVEATKTDRPRRLGRAA